MPTTQLTEFTGSIDTIAERTNSAGTEVNPHWKAEERRMAHRFFTAGIVTPSDAWEPVAGAAATMNVILGSGAAEVDLAIVEGLVSGQGNYLVRLDEATKTITLDAAGGSVRQDNIYLVVYDHAYDGQSRALPRIGVRKGDAGGADPGPDANWDAYLLLATVTIPGGAADITQCTVTDERTQSKILQALHSDHGSTHRESNGSDPVPFEPSVLKRVLFGEDADDGVADTSVAWSLDTVDRFSGSDINLNISIPAHWNSWVIVVKAWVEWERTVTNSPINMRIDIDGSTGPVFTYNADNSSNQDGTKIAMYQVTQSTGAGLSKTIDVFVWDNNNSIRFDNFMAEAIAYRLS